MIELNISANVIANLLIQDLQGRLVFKDEIKSNEKKLVDFSSFKNGVYIVKIQHNRKMHYSKLVKSS